MGATAIDNSLSTRTTNGTEHGVANDLVAALIPQEDIVLAFQSEYMGQYSDFAIN